jgi:hypothetical protein
MAWVDAVVSRARSAARIRQQFRFLTAAVELRSAGQPGAAADLTCAVANIEFWF